MNKQFGPTPRTIINDLMHYRITEEDAVKAIETLIANTVNDSVGYMGPTEYKYFIDICKDYYRSYGYPIRGNMSDLKDIVQQAIELCGFSKFEEIRNTKENRNKIRDAIVDNANRFFG